MGKYRNSLIPLFAIAFTNDPSYGTETLKVIAPAVPPIIFYDQKIKNGSGILADYWSQHIDSQINMKTVWVETIPADRILSQMNEQKIDMGISAKNIARFSEDQVEYSPEPIYQATQLIIGRKSWPTNQEKTVLVNADTLLPQELVSDRRFKIIRIYGLDQTSRMIELLEQKRAWGCYIPVHWIATLELLKRNILTEFAPFHLKGKPMRNFYVFSSKKVPLDIRKKVYRSLNHTKIQRHIDQSLIESCLKSNKTVCADFLERLN